MSSQMPPPPPSVSGNKPVLWGPKSKIDAILKAEEDARLAAEEAKRQAIILAAQEAARQALEKIEAEKKMREAEAARLAAEQEAARLAAEQEAARLAAEQEAAIKPVIFHEQFDNINTDIIYSGKQNFDLFISQMCLKLIENKRISFKTKSVFVNNNPKSLDTVISGHPVLYIAGGSAYDLYDKFLLGRQSSKINTVAPKTIDYDIICCVNKLDIDLLIRIFVDIINRNYHILNTDNYINNNFEDITSEVTLDPHEHIITLINNKLLISIHQHPRFLSNITIKLGLKRFDILERFADIFISMDDEVLNKISTIHKLKIDDNYYFVPDCLSLIKLSLVALINRSNDILIYQKCIKDHLRLKYFFELLNSLPDSTTQAVNYIKSSNSIYKDIFDFIMQFIPHCSKIIDNNDLQKDFFYKESIFTQRLRDALASILKIKYLKQEDFDKYKREVLAIVDIPGSGIRDYITKYNSGTQSGGNNTYYYKYLKYKNKYIDLKKLKF